MARLWKMWLGCRERAQNAPLRAALCTTLGLSILFAAFPNLDLAASALFYRAGHSFPLRESDMLRDLRLIGGSLPVVVGIALGAAVLLKLVNPRRRSLVPPQVAVFYNCLLVLGPVVVVNGLVKPVWGRPRPVDTVAFGGDLSFFNAWDVAACCAGNRSFVSGEAAAVACLLCLALFAPAAWRRPVTVLIGAFVAIVSLNRVAFGAHYLSDIVIAWTLVLIIALALRHLFFVRFPDFLSNRALERRLTHTGIAMHRVLRAVLARALRRRLNTTAQRSGA